VAGKTQKERELYLKGAKGIHESKRKPKGKRQRGGLGPGGQQKETEGRRGRKGGKGEDGSEESREGGERGGGESQGTGRGRGGKGRKNGGLSVPIQARERRAPKGNWKMKKNESHQREWRWKSQGNSVRYNS